MRYFWLPVLLLILAACNLQQPALPTPNAENVVFITATPQLPTPNTDNVIYITATPLPRQVTATPQAQVVAQSAPNQTSRNQANTAPPVISPTVTRLQPDVPLDTQLQQAQTYLLNGYFEQAVRTFQAILAQGETVAPELRAQAAFQLGQAAVKEGLFSEAVDALTTLITQFPQDERVPQAYFLRGDAYLGLSNWQAAIGDFQQYLALRPGLVDSYVYERTADAQFALGMTDDALANYNAALAANRSLVPELILREKLAQILINLGRVDDAIAQYDAILSVAQNAPYRALIELYAAQALLNNGRVGESTARAQRILDNYSTTASAYPAMQILLNNGVSVPSDLQGRIAYNQGEYAEAITAFNTYTTRVIDVPAEMYLLLGRAYRAVGNDDAAVVAFQTIINQYPGDPAFGEALLEQGRTRFLAGDIPEAISTYLNIADTYGYLSDAAAEALWRAGYLYGTNDQPARSREVFTRLAQEYPNDEWAVNGLFLAASAAVKSQNWSAAEQLYGRIAAISTDPEDQAAAYMWGGRLAQMQGNPAGASDALAQAIALAPSSYFAARAVDIQLGRTPFAPPSGYQFEFDAQTQRADAEAWLRSTFGITQQGDLAPLSPELANDPRMIRGNELWQLAAYDEARVEFDALIDEARETGNVLASYQLAVYLRDIGAYYSSIFAAADVIIAAGVTTLDAPPYIAQMRFPAYYVDVIQDVAPQIDPLLMLSLIRHESLFNTTATAAAGEKGLTQVIPGTAQYIANQLQWPDYQHSDLFRPYAGISFGAYYLDEQLRRFDGNAIAALAGYNAGPGRAIDWRALSGGDPDLFMTAITIDTTRLYVQRIYTNYNTYRALYGTG